MIRFDTIPDRLQLAFAPTQRGIVGLTEQLLNACVGSDVEFERVGDRIVCHWTENGDTHDAAVPLPPTAFRTILARIAVFCNEFSPNSVSPYGGEGLLTVEGDPLTHFQVAFVNTPEKQQLKLKSLGAKVVASVEKKSRVEPLHAEM